MNTKTIDYKDPKFIAMCKRMVMQDDTPEKDFNAMMYMAESKGLDPTSRHITLIPKRKKVNGNWQVDWKVLTQIDGFRFIAHSTGQYCGQDDPIFKYDGQGNLISATVTVYRWHEPSKSKCAYSYTAMYDEFVQTDKNGNPTRAWALGRGGMGHVMVAKCAEANAFRKGFPEMAGLYISEEMEQSTNPEPVIEKPRVASGLIEGHGHKIHKDEEPPLPEEPGLDERDVVEEDRVPSFTTTVEGARAAFREIVVRKGLDSKGFAAYVESLLECPIGDAAPGRITKLVENHWNTSKEAIEDGIKTALLNQKEAEKVAKKVQETPANDLPEPAQIITRMIPKLGPKDAQALFSAVKIQFGDITRLAGNTEARDWLLALDDMSNEDRMGLLKEINGRKG